MSFINKALERAKALHKKKEEFPASPPREMADLRMPPLQSIVAGREIAPPEAITYSLTRTVAVDNEVMRRNRLLPGCHDFPMEEYKLIRTHILQRTRGEGRNTLMITGPQPGEGKTLTAINLAISLSQEIGQTVLLVDVDLRFPSVAGYLGIATEKGLVDHLQSGVPLSELMVHPEGLAELVVLPAGRPVAEAAELVSSPSMANLVQELKNYYPDRYVLFDLPPLLSYADALAFAPLVDGIVLVVEAGKTPREDISRCLELLKKFPVLGFVLNKAQKDPTPYSYYDAYQRKEARPRKKIKIPWFK